MPLTIPLHMAKVSAYLVTLYQDAQESKRTPELERVARARLSAACQTTALTLTQVDISGPTLQSWIQLLEGDLDSLATLLALIY